MSLIQCPVCGEITKLGKDEYLAHDDDGNHVILRLVVDVDPDDDVIVMKMREADPEMEPW